MAEDTPEQDGTEDLIAGLEEGDIKPNFYEGGFKTWECALDLARLVIGHGQDGEVFSEDDGGDDWHVIEVCAFFRFYGFECFFLLTYDSSVLGLLFRLLRCSHGYFGELRLSRGNGFILPSRTITLLFSDLLRYRICS